MIKYKMNQLKNGQGQTSYEIYAPRIGVYYTQYCNDPQDAYDIATAAKDYLVKNGKFPEQKNFTGHL